MLITVGAITAHNPCSDYPRERVESLIGDGLTVAEFAGLNIPIKDRLWVLWRVLPDSITMPCVEQAVTRALNLPAVVEYAEKNPAYGQWRRAWLDGSDRSSAAAAEAWAAEAARSAWAAAEAWAAEAARSAWAAAEAARAARAALAAEAAARAAAEVEAAAGDKEFAAQLADLVAAVEELK